MCAASFLLYFQNISIFEVELFLDPECNIFFGGTRVSTLQGSKLCYLLLNSYVLKKTVTSGALVITEPVTVPKVILTMDTYTAL